MIIYEIFYKIKYLQTKINPIFFDSSELPNFDF